MSDLPSAVEVIIKFDKSIAGADGSRVVKGGDWDLHHGTEGSSQIRAMELLGVPGDYGPDSYPGLRFIDLGSTDAQSRAEISTIWQQSLFHPSPKSKRLIFEGIDWTAKGQYTNKNTKDHGSLTTTMTTKGGYLVGVLSEMPNGETLGQSTDQPPAASGESSHMIGDRILNMSADDVSGKEPPTEVGSVPAQTSRASSGGLRGLWPFRSGN